MSTTTSQPRAPAADAADAGEERFLFRGAGRALYEAIDEHRGESSVPRLTWFNGELEVMSPSAEHDHLVDLLEDLVKIVLRVLRVPYRSFRTTTWKQTDRTSKEADACFYVASIAAIRGVRAPALGVHPPPDLAIEVEINPAKVEIESVYADLGVPELWRHDGQRLRILQLGPDGRYVERERSPGLPWLVAAEVQEKVTLGDTLEDLQWADEIERWAREELANRPA